MVKKYYYRISVEGFNNDYQVTGRNATEAKKKAYKKYLRQMKKYTKMYVESKERIDYY